MNARRLSVVKADWQAPANIHAFTTTRLGGVSGAPFDSLNVAGHVGDCDVHVEKNRQRLIEQYEIPGSPYWLNQVHGTEVIELTERVDPQVPLTADGAWTQQPRLVCAVLTADCLPLLLTNERGDQVAAVHAGWRGMADGIIETAVSQLDEEPSKVLAWAGPCIGPAAFEVGEEVREQLGGSDRAYLPSSNTGKLLANLYLLAQQRLAAIGVTQYSHSPMCTYVDETCFFSYRRNGQCGRMASLIWIS